MRSVTLRKFDVPLDYSVGSYAVSLNSFLYLLWFFVDGAGRHIIA